MVPKNFSQEQKDIRRERYLDFLQSIETDPQFLECVVTGEESWMLEYNPETKRQSMEWHTSTFLQLQKAGKNKSNIKYLLICFLDSYGTESFILTSLYQVTVYQIHKNIVFNTQHRQTLITKSMCVCVKAGTFYGTYSAAQLDAAAKNRCSLVWTVSKHAANML